MKKIEKIDPSRISNDMIVPAVMDTVIPKINELVDRMVRLEDLVKAGAQVAPATADQIEVKTGAMADGVRVVPADDVKLVDMGVDAAWVNKLVELGFETVGDVRDIRDNDLEALEGIGAKTVEKIRNATE